MVDKYNILVVGSDGQLGNSIKFFSNEFDNYNFHFTNKNQLDISNYKSIEKYLEKYKIEVIINCAAYTNVGEAEINRGSADLINHVSVDNLAKICYENNIQLIHISTDYVFDGLKDSPYTETDTPCPINYYGLTKLNGEKRIMSYDLKNSVIIRTSWLYSELENNFVSKILDKINLQHNINVVDNEFGSPTNANDLALTILSIIPKIKSDKTEVYHFCNTGICSRYDLANEINRIIKGKSLIQSASISDPKIKRPKYSVLDSNKIIKKFNLEIRDWRHSLKDHLIDVVSNKLSSYEI
jgi:dTDP-4-dehydrorhamnose reductase